MKNLKKKITLIDGTMSDNYSYEYQRQCEAVTLSKIPLQKRREFINKLTDEKRVEDLKRFLTLIFKNRASDQQ
jgi:hypothetical protein